VTAIFFSHICYEESNKKTYLKREKSFIEEHDFFLSWVQQWVGASALTGFSINPAQRMKRRADTYFEANLLKVQTHLKK